MGVDPGLRQPSDGLTPGDRRTKPGTPKPGRAAVDTNQEQCSILDPEHGREVGEAVMGVPPKPKILVDSVPRRTFQNEPRLERKTDPPPGGSLLSRVA